MAGGEIVGVLDTNVLMRLGLLSFLLRAAIAGAFVPRWSKEIDEELTEKLTCRRPEIAEPVRDALSTVPDALLAVERRDHHLARGVCDGDDVHVLVAAVCAVRMVVDDRGRWPADTMVTLVTGNLRHFDSSASLALGVVVLGPDEFGCLLLRRRPAPLLRTIDRTPDDRYERLLRHMSDDGMVQKARLVDEVLRHQA